VRGEDTATSDIDLLVDLDPGVTLFDLSLLRSDLVDLLGIDMDVIPTGSTGPVMERILREAIHLCIGVRRGGE
jgi:predicted nucleotidyltransferase